MPHENNLTKEIQSNKLPVTGISKDLDRADAFMFPYFSKSEWLLLVTIGMFICTPLHDTKITTLQFGGHEIFNQITSLIGQNDMHPYLKCHFSTGFLTHFCSKNELLGFSIIVTLAANGLKILQILKLLREKANQKNLTSVDFRQISLISQTRKVCL